MSQAQVFVFIGASGSGKDELARQVCARNKMFEFPKKPSSREVRSDDTNVVHREKIDFRENEDELGYIMNGHTYVALVSQIKKRIEAGYSQILIASSNTALARLRIIFANLRVIFIHRDLSRDQLREILIERGLQENTLEHGLLQRTITRELLYNLVAGGLINPDHVIINDTIENMVAQFDRIVVASRQTARFNTDGPKVHIIVTGTGRNKKFALQALQSIPGGHRSIIPKYLLRERRSTDGPETMFTGEIPVHCIRFSFFGNDYGVDAADAARVASEQGIGFVTVSDLKAAYKLAFELQQGYGLESRLIYMHQPEVDLRDYPQEQWEDRRRHAASLLETYQQQFVAWRELHVILAESREVVCSYFQRMLNEVQFV